MRRLAGALLAMLTLTCATQAQALCIYGGELYKHSTITGEFRESPVVVRGTVLANHDIWPIIEDDDDHDYLAVAVIRVDAVLKGHPKKTLLLYSRRNSGGFYVDEGKQYLLFLGSAVDQDWTEGYRPDHVAFAKAYDRPMWINYSCGQSVPWRDVTAAKRRVLDYETRRLR